MWRVTSYNSFDLTDGYLAYLTDENNPYLLPSVGADIIKRGPLPATLARLERESDQVVVTVKVTATDKRAALDALVAACPNTDETLHALKVQDSSAVEWQVQARVSNIKRTAYEHVYEIAYTVPDRMWRSAATPVTWNVTSTPATQAVTNGGTQVAFPVITIEPASARGGGFVYRHWLPIINNVASTPLPLRGFNLAGTVVDTTGWVANASVSNQINNGGGITAIQTTIPIDTAVGGGLPSSGMGYVDTEQISWTGNSGTQLSGVTRGIGGTTAATHADNAVIKQSFVQANFADCRLFKGATEQDLWVRSPNSANTKLWMNLTLSAPISLTVAAIGTGALTTITVQIGAANDAALSALPSSGVLLIDSEAFIYSGKSVANRTITITSRAAKDTTEASHSTGATAKWIEHDYWLFTGDPSLTARSNNDLAKPMFDLDASTNTSQVYYQFWDAAGLRTSRWTPQVVAASYPALNSTRYYSGNHQDESADPATDAGLRITSVYYNSRWNIENGDVRLFMNDPCGITNITWVAETYRVGTYWPSVAGIRKSNNGSTWTSVLNAPTPGSASSWTAYTPALQSIGAAWVEIRLQGSVPAAASNEADLETDTITLTITTPPTCSIGSRTAASYTLDATLENTTNGEFFRVQFTIKTGQSLTIDCEAKTVIYSLDGLTYRDALYKDETQTNWLSLEVGSNSLRFTETAVVAVDVLVEFDQLRGA